MITEPYFVRLSYRSSSSSTPIEKAGAFDTKAQRDAWVNSTLNAAAGQGYRLTDVRVSYGEVTEQYEAERIWNFTPINGTVVPTTTELKIKPAAGSLEL